MAFQNESNFSLQKKEINTFLGDIIKHMTPDRAYEEFYPQLMSVMSKVLAHQHDFSLLFALVGLFVCLFVCLFLCFCVCLFVCLFNCLLSVCQWRVLPPTDECGIQGVGTPTRFLSTICSVGSICVSICVLISLFVCLFECLLVCLWRVLSPMSLKRFVCSAWVSFIHSRIIWYQLQMFTL